MATDFPTDLDTPNAAITESPPGTETLGSAGHSGRHNDLEDRTIALETKVGIDGSADTDSLDYKVAHGASGSVATDAIWDAKGDLAGGTGANTAAVLTAGANDTILMADSAATTGLKWVASATPGAVTPDASAAVGTADTFTRGDHEHGIATYSSIAAAVGTASAGTSATAPSRGNHVHPTGAGTPVAVGTANSVGIGPAAAMTNHVHAHEVAHVVHDTIWDAKGDIVAGTAADTSAVLTAGANDTILMADSAQTTGLKWVASATPGAVTPDASAATGTADTFTRGDHEHGMATYSSTPAAIGTGAAGTSATAPSRGNHVHATGAGTPSTQALGDSASTGSGPAAAMTDHKHAMPAAAITTSGLTQATARLLGRTTASPGAVEEITVGTGLSLSAGSLTATGGSGSVATDAIWDAAGDLAVGTGADTAAKLAISVPAANILNVVGVVNGESTWSVKAVHDGTAPAAIGTAAAGTSLLSSHRDHVHATGAGTPSTQALGDAAATGSGPAAAMTDHKHAMFANSAVLHNTLGDQLFGAVSGSAITITNLATLQTLTGMAITIPQSSTGCWFFEEFLILNGSSGTADWKVGYSVTSGITMSWSMFSSSDVSPSTGWSTAGTAATPVAAVTAAGTVTFGGFNGQILVHRGGWIFSNNTAAASVTPQACQNTQTNETTTVGIGSWIRATRIIA